MNPDPLSWKTSSSISHRPFHLSMAEGYANPVEVTHNTGSG
jgi:hypothetical protein